MSTLRDGPVGKLIARREAHEEQATVAVEEPAVPEVPKDAAAKDAKRALIPSPKEALDELQRLADEQVRGVLGVAISHVQQLQGEVKRLQARIEELEQRLVVLQKRGDEEQSGGEGTGGTSVDG